jgi:phosphoribosylformylglycinamidine (FGAM) synthase-like enzyme
MSAYEMMLSESQERMLMVLRPEKAEAEAIFIKWGLDFAMVGKTTDTLRFVVNMRAMSSPIFRSRNSAMRRRNMTAPGSTEKSPVLSASRIAAPKDYAEALKTMSAMPTGLPGAGSMSSTTRWSRATRPQRPAATPASSASRAPAKGLAFSVDVTPRYCRGRSVRGRQAGRRRSLAQSHRRRLRAAGGNRQPELRQPGKA